MNCVQQLIVIEDWRSKTDKINIQNARICMKRIIIKIITGVAIVIFLQLVRIVSVNLFDNSTADIISSILSMLILFMIYCQMTKGR